MNREDWNEFRKHPKETIYIHGHIIGVKDTLIRAKVKAGSVIGAGLTAIARDNKKDPEETFVPWQSIKTEEDFQKYLKTREEGGKLIEKNCIICGKTFEAGGNEVTCSIECQRIYRSRAASKRKTKGKEIKLDGSMTINERRKTCPNCGTQFMARNKEQTYCSRKCRYKYEYKLKRGEIK